MMPNQMRTISATPVGDALVMQIVPDSLHELDLTPLQHELFEAVRDSGVSRFVIDFSRLTYLPTTALGVLLKCQRQIETDGGRLHLAAMSPRIKEVFIISDLTRVLAIFDTCEQAVQAFALAK